MKSTKFQRVFWCYHYFCSIREQDEEKEINMAAKVEVSSPVKCFSSQTLEAWRNVQSVQGSYLEWLPDWSSDSDVPRDASGWLPLQSCRGEYLHLRLHVRNVWEGETSRRWRANPRGRLSEEAQIELKTRRGEIVSVQGHLFTCS